MNHYTVQFIVESGIKILGIVFHTVNTDENITFNGIVTIRESDDVGQCIVVEVFDIHFVQVVVTAKNIGDCTERFTFDFNRFFYPITEGGLFK